LQQLAERGKAVEARQIDGQMRDATAEHVREGDEHHARPSKRVVITVFEIDLWREGCNVLDVGRDSFRRLAGTVNEHDLARAAPLQPRTQWRSQHFRCR
jgi:hypothetical protein